MKKTDPSRVARVLREAFERQPRRVGRSKPNLMEFCERHGFDYKLTSKWMHRGLAYVHPKSEEVLEKLVEALGIKWDDLWEKDVIEVSPETIAALIRRLDEVKTELLSLAGRVKVNAPPQPFKPPPSDLELDAQILDRVRERVRTAKGSDEVLGELLKGSDRIPALHAANASWVRVRFRKMVTAKLETGIPLAQAIDVVIDDFAQQAMKAKPAN